MPGNPLLDDFERRHGDPPYWPSEAERMAVGQILPWGKRPVDWGSFGGWAYQWLYEHDEDGKLVLVHEGWVRVSQGTKE